MSPSHPVSSSSDNERASDVVSGQGDTEQPERWRLWKCGRIATHDHEAEGCPSEDLIPASALEAAEREIEALNERRLRERRVFADLAERLDARVRRLEGALREIARLPSQYPNDPKQFERMASDSLAAQEIARAALSPDETAGEREAEGEGGDAA